MEAIDIGYVGLALSYVLLLVPLSLILWLRVPILGDTMVSIVRMTVQLLFVGLYLQVLFEWNSLWVNLIWIFIMVTVADITIIRGCGLRLKYFMVPVLVSLFLGTGIPLLYLVVIVLRRPNLLDARYAIPIAGMILGNCLRADIIGIRTFYKSMRKNNRDYLNRLAFGAERSEAIRPYLRDAFRLSIAPTVATMATIGLVSLPGMMTGVMLGGTAPSVAIKYQIAIMIAIFTGTAVTVASATLMTLHSSFTAYGVLDLKIFARS